MKEKKDEGEEMKTSLSMKIKKAFEEFCDEFDVSPHPNFGCNHHVAGNIMNAVIVSSSTLLTVAAVKASVSAGGQYTHDEFKELGSSLARKFKEAICEAASEFIDEEGKKFTKREEPIDLPFASEFDAAIGKFQEKWRKKRHG